MKNNYERREFIRMAAAAGIGLGIPGGLSSLYARKPFAGKDRIGIIGLDTSHCQAFTRALNAPNPDPELGGFKVVAAYPKGSSEIKHSVERIPAITEEVRSLGVEITGSIEDLLKKVDVVMLETNDGRLHLEQALQVLKAGKPMFIDKPIAASLADTLAIFEAARHYNVPVFSSSSLRFMPGAQKVAKENLVGKVLGADTYSPATIEKTHPDLFWYGIHGVELLFTVMGRGCKSVTRTFTDNTDIVVGTWEDNRIGTFRGLRSGKADYGGIAFGETGIASLGPFEGYKPLLLKIIAFFRTGETPVSQEDTLEIITFMEAAEESKRRNGASVSLESIMQNAKKA
jgi:predicted dehydrogenase